MRVPKTLEKAFKAWKIDKPRFYAQATDDVAEVLLYDVIGSDLFTAGISAKQFAETWQQVRGMRRIVVRINSPGGDVYEGMAMRALILEERPRVEVRVDGLAGSIASVIAIAGEKTYISDGGAFFLHEPWAFVLGTSQELRTTAEQLDVATSQLIDIYHDHTGVAKRDWARMMKEETLIGASQAIELGLAEALPADDTTRYLNHWRIAINKLRQGIT